MPQLIPLRVRLSALLAGCVVALAALPAAAQEAPPPKKKGVEKTHIPDAEASENAFTEKRAVPDFDGRGPKPTSVGDVAIWIPRIIVSPIYLTSEYLIRRPLGGVIMGVERDHIAQKAIQIFTFGGREKIGLVPTFFVDFGVLPSVGLYFFADDAFAPHNHVRVHFGTWGPDWLNIGVVDRYDVGKDSTAAIHASWSRRSDYPFFGLGPNAREENESRYAATILDVGPVYEIGLAPGVRFNTSVGVRDTSFGEGACCGDPTLQSRVRNGELALPPRFADGGYTIGYQRAELTFDTRARRPLSQSGVRLAMDGQPAVDVSHRPGNSWLRYGATAAAFWDVTGKARVVSLSLATLFADPLSGGAGAIPFNELVSLGGTTLMRGFLAGRLIDRSAVVATVAYQWPIWVFLDGTMQLSTGNVFGAGLQDFSLGKLRLSSGLGVRTNSSPDHQFEVIAGFGTDTFENGAKITSLRLAFGATRGF
jgi:hypothetical protein